MKSLGTIETRCIVQWDYPDTAGSMVPFAGIVPVMSLGTTETRHAMERWSCNGGTPIVPD